MTAAYLAARGALEGVAIGRTAVAILWQATKWATLATFAVFDAATIIAPMWW